MHTPLYFHTHEVVSFNAICSTNVYSYAKYIVYLKKNAHFKKGVFFHKYGRVSLVTSQDRMFLKSSRSFNSSEHSKSDAKNRSKRSDDITKEMLKEKVEMGRDVDREFEFDKSGEKRRLSTNHVKSIIESILQDLSHHHETPAASDLKNMLTALDDSNVRRKLADALDQTAHDISIPPPSTSSSSSKSIGSAISSKIGLSIGSATTDKDYYVYHLPSSGGASSPVINHDIPKCLYLLNLKVGPSCDEGKCGKNNPPHSAMTLEGRIHSDNCNV
jgi:hypothetical protein